MNTQILDFGKFKGMNFNSTPESYQKWLLNQDWFRKAITDRVDAKKQELKNLFDRMLVDAQSMIGKTILADSWSYDNYKCIQGTITQISKAKFGADVFGVSLIEVMTDNGSIQFSANQIQTLLDKGELPTANKFLNTGTNAKITN